MGKIRVFHQEETHVHLLACPWPLSPERTIGIMCGEIRGHAKLAFSFTGPEKAWPCLSLGTAARVLVQTLTGELTSKLWRDRFTPHLW